MRYFGGICEVRRSAPADNSRSLTPPGTLLEISIELTASVSIRILSALSL
ncbi:MAG: hypothetical protein LBR80_10770 [Deltaproteobacteria bacterium]|nr:hypothetical protein [Deltaproteobacteria bacterium]